MAQTVQNLPAVQETWFGKIPWRRKWQPAPVLLSGVFHGQRSLADYSPWGYKELNTTEWLTFSQTCKKKNNVLKEKFSFRIRPLSPYKLVSQFDWLVTIVIYKSEWSSELNSPIPVHFSSLVPKMSVFTLAISCLTTSNLPWFMDLAFQVPMQYCSLQHWTLLPSPVTFATGCCFCFGSVSSFFLVLFLHSSPVAYWIPTDRPGEFIFQYHIFSPFHTVHGVSHGKNTEVVCHSLLQWTMFCQNFPQWPVHLGWPYMAWLIVSLV